MEIYFPLLLADLISFSCCALISCRLQLANSSMDYDPLYDAEKGFTVMPSSFHDISEVEFQDNWGRVWYGFDI